MGKPQLIVCGSIAIDRIMNFNGRYRDLIKPDKIHVLSISPLLDKLENTTGGVGANIAYNLALLHEQPILLGSVGTDAAGYMKNLSRMGIDTAHIHVSEYPTASFNVITDSENNQVGGFYQGAMADSDSLSFSPWKGKDVVAMVSAHNPAAMRRQVLECQKNDIKLVYDPGQQVSDPSVDLKAGIEAAEVLFVNDYERSVLTEKVGISYEELKTRVPVIVTTLGEEGSVIEGNSVPTPLTIPIAKPTQVVDPTGAGDAYRAGFLYGYLREWDLSLCGQMGSVAASFAVEHHGTQKHYFSLDEFIKRYKDTFKQELLFEND